uniref:CcxT n=2 Tax=Cochliobolus sativus TaxID=45130 RepID=A0A4D6Q4Q9_COCSA|nr:CcxT [Bipolaris sorokiniana]
MASVSTDDVDGPGNPKRRKLRKGTHSCWACKRRKEKCVPCADDSTICLGCRKRNTACIAQDQPEETTDHFLPATITTGIAAANPGTAPATDVTAPPPLRAPLASYSHLSCRIPSMAEISKTLHDALPSPEECDIIYRASSRHSAMLNGSTLTMPYTWLDPNDPNGPTSSGSLPAPASVDSHPVLLARHILNIVTLLQDLHPNIHHELAGLHEPPRVMAERLAELAIRLVTSQDRMLASVEGLECVVMESIYHGNCGSLRLSWMACRRAMLLAQLLGLHVHTPATPKQYPILDHATRCDPQYMWFRIVHYDRYMCLLLGLPQGSTDVSMASEALLATDTAMGGLERVQCVIASRILQRNESDPTSVDFSVTQSLDKDLQRAAQTLPSKWWLVPDLGNPMQTKQEVCWDVQRLYVQIFHFNLLNQLHVPYMLLSSTDRRFVYSKFACVNSSREILSRFAVLRRSNQVAYNCRTVDYLAVMAAVTLLLAHLDSYRHPSQVDIMTHLYLGDRAMIEQAQENLQEVSRLNEDSLSRQSAELLRRLLAIEAEAADGYDAPAHHVVVQQVPHNTPLVEKAEEDASQMHIPYFGLIKFALEGIAARATSYPNRSIGHSDMQSQAPISHSAARLNMSYASASSSQRGLDDSGTTLDTQTSDERESLMLATPYYSTGIVSPAVMVSQQSGHASVHEDVWNPKFSEGGFFDALLPGLTGNGEWSLEGIDMDYFERLMAGST